VRGERACTWNEGKRLGTQRAGPIFELLPLISAPSVSPPSFGLLSVLNLPSTPTHGSGHPIRPKTRARKPQTRRTTTPQACWRHRLIYPSRRPPPPLLTHTRPPRRQQGSLLPPTIDNLCVIDAPTLWFGASRVCGTHTHHPYLVSAGAAHSDRFGASDDIRGALAPQSRRPRPRPGVPHPGPAARPPQVRA
jgi:hypothetical protein